jgi:membrane-associated phospholipid phosphatase
MDLDRVGGPNRSAGSVVMVLVGPAPAGPQALPVAIIGVIVVILVIVSSIRIGNHHPGRRRS